jgi:hypothetical protein
MHTKFCVITGLCFRTQFKAMTRNYIVQGYRIAKGAYHNRTSLSHFNMETKTEPVFATLYLVDRASFTISLYFVSNFIHL